jgi:hypothetical protein
MAGAHHEREMGTTQPYSMEYCLAIVRSMNFIGPIPKKCPTQSLPDGTGLMQAYKTQPGKQKKLGSIIWYWQAAVCRLLFGEFNEASGNNALIGPAILRPNIA